MEGRHGSPIDWAIDSAGAAAAALKLRSVRVRRPGRHLMRRIPIESAAPIVVFAIARLAVAVVALAAVAVVDFPDQEAAAVVLAVFVAWSVAVLVVARWEPERVVNPMVAAGDFALLLAVELAAPDAIGAVRLTALFLIAAHAHFQGEQRGLAIAAIGSTTPRRWIGTTG